ncbi:MAG: DNA mismatch repair protein MutS [Bacteroidales bacterium]
MNEDKKIVETPLMKQYFSIKAKYPDAILLFRVGDFYETFGEDAIVASNVLGIVLTRRANGSAAFVELAGFPHHSIDSYLPKLVRAGYKVAVCDQLEDPKLTKKIVKRGITELVTPGVSYNDQLLSNSENNYLASVYFSKDKAGIAFLDISTGSFKVATGDLKYIDLLLSSLNPKEILLQRGYREGFEERFGKDYYISFMDEWAFVYDSCREKLHKQFGVNSLKGYGIENMPLSITAAGSILFYLEMTRHEGLSHLCSISRIDETDYVWIDKFTFRNLEVFNSGNEGAVSLVNILDKCSSPMGSRLLRTWLMLPLKSTTEINRRLAITDYLYKDKETRQSLRTILKSIGDLERITSKASAGKVSPRELTQLNRGLSHLSEIKNICQSTSSDDLITSIANINLCSDLRLKLDQTLLAEPAGQIGKGDVIANGVNEELDSLRNIARHGKEVLNSIQEREIERTGITSLKISYNNVFGYYLEVRNTHKEKVPEDWIRKQTLVNAERYITQELKEYEEKILGAEEKILALESSIYSELLEYLRQFINDIQRNCNIISRIDVLNTFAEISEQNRYSKPTVNEEEILSIKEGRHPVIETLMPPGEEYISNDLYLDNSTQQIIILTGPNMAGKSALLRQTALIVLMAQIGCFVPASNATIGVFDKIFTRVGASDNISRGESTFMVEMLETSTILHNLSSRSLVLLDEIGRGTSTYDGMSIAWSIVDFIHSNKDRAKTIFATHYHELNELAEQFDRVKNFNVSVKEVDNRVIFLRKLLPGGVEHSFGIHVARMAGMPGEVIKKAERILKKLEEQNKGEKGIVKREEAVQLSFFQLEDPLLVSLRDELKSIDINQMSPLDAFDKLRQLKKKIGL